MKKEKIRLLISLLLTLALLFYCWFNLLLENYIPSWKHYAALLLMLIPIWFFFRNKAFALLSLGIYLLLGSVHIISLSATQSTFHLVLFDRQTPGIQLATLFVFILYFSLNVDTLIELQLDYKERKALK